ncbi:unnamed protein product [Cercospora beticola]|nr:unnamed protein product [Cercospora beticola]
MSPIMLPGVVAFNLTKVITKRQSTIADHATSGSSTVARHVILFSYSIAASHDETVTAAGKVVKFASTLEVDEKNWTAQTIVGRPIGGRAIASKDEAVASGELGRLISKPNIRRTEVSGGPEMLGDRLWAGSELEEQPQPGSSGNIKMRQSEAASGSKSEVVVGQVVTSPPTTEGLLVAKELPIAKSPIAYVEGEPIVYQETPDRCLLLRFAYGCFRAPKILRRDRPEGGPPMLP